MYLFKTDHAVVKSWCGYFCPQSSILNMVHPMDDIRDLNLVVLNQEILYVSIYKSMLSLWHPG